MMRVRPAAKADLGALYAELRAGDHEAVDLGRAVVFVAEDERGLAGFIAARLTLQVEPLLLFRRLEEKGARRRATLLLARAMDAYLPRFGLRGYYAFIRDRAFQGLARAFGMRDVYETERCFLREF